MMYTSVDVDVYIICDEQAQAYLERRLALVKRPRYNLRVWFYRLSWDAMRGRIDREGTVNTVHVAGVREYPADWLLPSTFTLFAQPGS